MNLLLKTYGWPLFLCLALAAPAPALGEARAKGLDPVYTWEAAAPREQAAADSTRTPRGKGAIFVPSMTSPELESMVVVLDNERRSTTGSTGERVIVTPGRHTVVIGSSQGGGRTIINVEVAAGETVIPRIAWGGLRVDVADREGRSHRGGYELYSLASGKSCGLGFGVDQLTGSRPRTWLLKPGVYRIVPPGAGLSGHAEAISVTVRAGGLVRFKLVMEPEGKFAGGTALTPVEAEASASERAGPWRHTLALGVDGMLSHSSDMVGMSDQLFLAAGAVVHGGLSYRGGWHLFTVDLDLEGGLAFIGAADGERLPLLKTKDRGRLQLLYGLLLGEWIGPYARGVATTHLFPTDTFFPAGATLSVRRLDGTTAIEHVQPNTTYRTSGAGAPAVLQAGVGLALNLLKRANVTLDLRAGVANRYSVFNGTLTRQGEDADGMVALVEVDDYNQVGLEGSLELSARLTGWLTYSTGLEYFGELEAMDRPVLEWRNVLGVRLSRYFSLLYNINLLRQPDVVDATQLQQSVQLRALFNVF